MNYRILILYISLFCYSAHYNCNSQILTKDFYQINKTLSEKAIKDQVQPIDEASSDHSIDQNLISPFKVLQKINSQDYYRYQKIQKEHILKSDTLIVGFGYLDTLEINKVWEQKGPIIIGTNGVLRIKADSKIYGDIFLINNARLEITNANIYLPQKYFYERSIIVTGKSVFKAENVRFDYSGLSHNLVVIDSGLIDFRNVTNYGFTTTGLNGNATFLIDSTNEAGEFVITDRINLDIKKSNIILLWHHFGKNSSLDFEFPKGDTLDKYICNKSIKGFKGIEYNIEINNSRNVMWGLMPEDNTNITIKNSKMRTIGLWFTGNDQINLNGIVDNSDYTDYTLNADDRILRLINSSVQTWSIYTFNNADVSIKGSIIGEIGSQGKSRVNAMQTFCDGTGGYVWSTDTTFLVYAFSTLTTAFRTQGHSIGVLGYSALSGSVASAVGNSNLIVIQTPLSEDPIAYEAGAVWLINMEKPSIASINSKILISGLVWINKGPYNQNIEFGSYKLEYRRNNDTKWNLIGKNYKNEIYHDTIAIWNTQGLVADQYIVKLTLYNSFGDSVEAMKNINLQEKILGVEEVQNQLSLEITPNPITERNEIIIKSSQTVYGNLKVFDESGKVYFNADQTLYAGLNHISPSNLHSGSYFCRFKKAGIDIIRKIVVY